MEFWIFQIEKFWKLEIIGMVQNGKLTNFENFLNLKHHNLASKIGNFGIVRPFNIPRYWR